MAEAYSTGGAAKHGTRVFELRIYEGATDQDHRRKVEMMQSGESEIFAKTGVEQVFYSDTLIGTRLPNLTYMLALIAWLTATRNGQCSARLTIGKRIQRCRNTRLRRSFPT